MSAIPISTQPSNPSRDSWITPDDQLLSLAFNNRLQGLDKKPGGVIDQICVSALKSLLQSIEDESHDTQPSNLFGKIVNQYVFTPLPPNLTNWYKALKRINALPEKIPSLPLNIREILESACPIFSTDEAPRRIGETHSLYLIPPGTLNELVERVKGYGETFFQGENPLKLTYSSGIEKVLKSCDTTIHESRWVLLTNNVFPKSTYHRYGTQPQMVTDLNEKCRENYEIPNLREFALSFFFHKIATGANLYQTGNPSKVSEYQLIRPAEETVDLEPRENLSARCVVPVQSRLNLVINDFSSPSGLRVFAPAITLRPAHHIGVVALRKL